MIRYVRQLLALALVVAATAAPVAATPRADADDAHELGQSYVFLRVYSDSLIVRLEIAAPDLERALALGWDPDVPPTLAQIEDRLGSIRAYVEPRLSMESASGPLTLRFRGFNARYVDIADFVLLEYEVEGWDGIPDEIEVTYSVIFELDSNHRNMLVIEHNWRTATFNNEAIISLIFSPRSATQTLDLTSSSILNGFMGFIWLGVWHIWIGIDHILFLMALVLPAVLYRSEGEWRPQPTFRRALWAIVKIVTFFTIAHTVTLSMAALGIVELPSRIVESIIAGSIAVAAWANLAPGLNIKEAGIAFAFGLFHGFGFASVLGDIGMGREFLVLSLLGFNIGVELGQIAIVAAAFPILFALRRTKAYPWFLKIGSILLIAIALLWFFERLFGFNVPVVPLIRGVVGDVASLFGAGG